MACLSRHTITGLLTTAGCQLRDWSADYRFFSKTRFAPDLLFRVNRQEIVTRLPPDAPFIAAMDDSVMSKSGNKIKGVALRRDPLSPPYRVNLVKGQRVIQVSGLFPSAMEDAPSRMIPIDFVQAPSAAKPPRHATPEAVEEYNRRRKELSLSRQGVERIIELRRNLDKDEPEKERPLWVLVDGSYTNAMVLKNLPANTTLIGRTRADAKLYYPPGTDEMKHPGRTRVYGERAMTPEQVRQEDCIPWETVEVYAAGKMHAMKVKSIAPVLWRTAGPQPLRLVVIAPLGYRPTKQSRILYRRPAYLICTNPLIRLADIVRAYVQRWDIETNFRDEKQIIGVGEAQVWNEASVENAPALAVAAYGMLLLAGTAAFGTNGVPNRLPLPKWRWKHKKKRASTTDYINQLRYELWGEALAKGNSYGFVTPQGKDMKPQIFETSLASAVLYARN